MNEIHIYIYKYYMYTYVGSIYIEREGAVGMPSLAPMTNDDESWCGRTVRLYIILYIYTHLYRHVDSIYVYRERGLWVCRRWHP
jgi:hypothetical protein